MRTIPECERGGDTKRLLLRKAYGTIKSEDRQADVFTCMGALFEGRHLDFAEVSARVTTWRPPREMDVLDLSRPARGGRKSPLAACCARDLLMYLQRLRNGPCGTLRSGGYRREKLVDFRLQAGAVVREQPR